MQGDMKKNGKFRPIYRFILEMTHTRQGHSYCGMQTGNHNLAFGWYNFKTDLPLLHLQSTTVIVVTKPYIKENANITFISKFQTEHHRNS